MGGAEGYMTANSYPDDGLGEVFLKMSKQGSTLAGMMDAFSIAVSVGLQYGVPLETYVSKFTNMRFEPAGMTDDPDVRMAQSIVDYIFRRLALDFLPSRPGRRSASTPRRSVSATWRPVRTSSPSTTPRWMSRAWRSRPRAMWTPRRPPPPSRGPSPRRPSRPTAPPSSPRSSSG
ncbi:hypothetical protein SAZ11_17480 [Streptomyces sp. FXJ1.4098]|nr:hypothetical protein [Streptomyces sp. FXJ1.4098]